MLCDELKKQKYCQKLAFGDEVYLAKIVDPAIAELKDKCQMHDFFWEGCGFAKRGFKNTIAVSEAFDRLEAENAELKAKLEDAKATAYADSVDAGMREWKLKEERRWRSVSEELPPHDTWCLVYHEGEIDSDHYTDDCNSHDRFVMYGSYVTHWMPLPSAPKEAK